MAGKGIPTQQNGPGWANKQGVAGVPFASADASAGVVAVTDAPATNERIVVDDLFISVGANLAVTFSEETSGTVILGPLYMLANTTIHLSPRDVLQCPVAGRKLMVRTSGAGNISVQTLYHGE